MAFFNLSKNAFFIVLPFLSFTASQASYQDLFQEGEGEHAQFNARASAIEYEWDTTKILLTAGTIGAITYGIGPRVADITNYLFPNFIPSLKWIYNRSEIGPITAELYAKTQKLRDKIPKSPFPPFTIKVSSLEMPLDEVLLVGLKDRYKHELKHLDQLLSEGITESHKISNFGWKKFPLYGRFANAQRSITDYLACGLWNQDYLVGYIYKNSRYVVRIEKIFNKPRVQDDPAFETCERDFYRIHRAFKQKGKGKKLEEISYYQEGSHPHPHLRINNLINIMDPAKEQEVKSFIHSFLETLEHPSPSKQSLGRIFNNLVMLTRKKSVFLSLGGRTRDVETKEPLNDNSKGKELLGEQNTFNKIPPSSSSSSSGPSQLDEETLLDQMIEQSQDIEVQNNREDHSNENDRLASQKNKIQIYMAQDESGKPYQYLSFLFYTHEGERYNILLHIKDKVNHNFSLFSDFKGDKDENEEKAPDLKGKKTLRD